MFSPEARTKSIATALRSIQYKLLYACKSTLSCHIEGQLGSNTAYSYPHFADVVDIEVKRIIVEEVESLLCDKNVIDFKSQPSLPVATSLPAPLPITSNEDLTANFVLNRSEHIVLCTAANA